MQEGTEKCGDCIFRAFTIVLADKAWTTGYKRPGTKRKVGGFKKKGRDERTNGYNINHFRTIR